MAKSFLVIGLGRFGTSLACALAEAGHYVLGVDRARDVVQALAGRLTHVVQLDAADEEALRSLDVSQFDAAVVGMASDFESSVLVTLLLKRLGARRIIARALSETQKEVLSLVGADEVIQPEMDAGVHLARRLVTPNILEYLTLGPGISVAEVQAPSFMAGKTLSELNIRRRYGVTVLVIKNSDRLVVLPGADERIEQGDTLVVVGRDKDIARLRE